MTEKEEAAYMAGVALAAQGTILGAKALSRPGVMEYMVKHAVALTRMNNQVRHDDTCCCVDCLGWSE